MLCEEERIVEAKTGVERLDNILLPSSRQEMMVGWTRVVIAKVERCSQVWDTLKGRT